VQRKEIHTRIKLIEDYIHFQIYTTFLISLTIFLAVSIYCWNVF